MRILAVVLLAACGTSHSTCPATRPDEAIPCDPDLRCTYAESPTRNVYCTCQLGHLWCSDCDANEYGFGACNAGESCSYSSWETDCDCTCTSRNTWNCTSSDVVSPCPRDPDPVDAGAR